MFILKTKNEKLVFNKAYKSKISSAKLVLNKAYKSKKSSYKCKI